MDAATILALGQLAIKLGFEGWEAYVELNQENADAFAEDQVLELLAKHKDTAALLADLGVEGLN